MEEAGKILELELMMLLQLVGIPFFCTHMEGYENHMLTPMLLESSECARSVETPRDHEATGLRRWECYRTHAIPDDRGGELSRRILN